jgi:hypothetical protein
VHAIHFWRLSCALRPILSRCCYLFLTSLTAALAIPSASTEEALEGVAVLNAPCQRHRQQAFELSPSEGEALVLRREAEAIYGLVSWCLTIAA